MALSGAAAEAERVLSIGLAQADQNVSLRSKRGKAEAREILEMLERADAELERRLQREARRFGPAERFTGAGLLAYRRQVQTVSAYVRARMGKMSRRQARANIREGWTSTVGLLGELEQAFSGSVRPLRINSARMMNERTRGVRASLLRQHATSMDRYGEEMERVMRTTLQTNLLAGGTFSQAVDQLVRHGGPRGRVSVAARELGDGTVERTRLETIPEGLFRRHRWWAMRIVRTETAYAQNAAGHEAIAAAKDVDFPDMQKKILAMMDNRTYPDSIAVHGQIRDVEAMFRDGAGREYLHPPARPNDREVVIPWRPGWEEVPTAEPRTALEEALERARAARGTETLPEDEVARLLRETPLHERLVEEEGAHGLGGAGSKRILVDPVTGQRYLFKVAQAKGSAAGRAVPGREQALADAFAAYERGEMPHAAWQAVQETLGGAGTEEFRARAQEVFSQIATRVRPGHLNIETMTHGGQLGTLQPMLELDDPPDFRAGSIRPRDLSPADALQVAQEHVLDWATSNHDTHSENLVRTRDGRILSIDKEQGYRYFGDADEQLSTSYAPNRERYGEEEPYYNRFWREFEAGRVDFDPMELRETFDRLEAAAQTPEVDAAFEAYAMSRPTTPGASPAGSRIRAQRERARLVTRMSNRAMTSRAQFEDFIERRYRTRERNAGTFSFEEGWIPAPERASDFTNADLDAATQYARDALERGDVPELESPHQGSNQSETVGRGRGARMLRGLRRAISNDRVGEMSDAMISHWAGRSTNGAASLVTEALGHEPDRAEFGYHPRRRESATPEENHAEELAEGLRQINSNIRYSAGHRHATTDRFVGTQEEAVDATRVQIAATRALLEREGISSPGQSHRVLRGLGSGGLAEATRRAVREARRAGETTIRVPMRTISSTALVGEDSSTTDGGFGRLVIDFEIDHDQIFSHFRVDGELLSGEAEIVAIFPDGYVEVEVDRVIDMDAGGRVPKTP